MKHRQLHSIAHNYADSLASGLGFVVGYCETFVFEEAAACNEGHITIDFLTGKVSGGSPSDDLERAISLYRDAFPGFCRKHGADISDFRAMSVRYMADRLSRWFTVTIEDMRDHRSSIDYEGVPGHRVRILDELGRIRPKVG